MREWLVIGLAACGSPGTVATATTAMPPTTPVAVVAAAPPGYAGPLPKGVELPDGYVLSAGFHAAAEVTDADAAALGQLVLRMERAGAVVWQRDGLAAITAPAVHDLGSCYQYVVSLAPETWGDGSGVHVSVACRNGEDNFTARELAILLEITDPARPPFPPLWSGDAAYYEDTNGACHREVSIAYTLAGSTLTMVHTDEREASNPQCLASEQPRVAEPPQRHTTTVEVRRKR